MSYLTIKETAKLWGISERTVNALCTKGRVEGAVKFGAAWAIPEGAKKPQDPRRKSTEDDQGQKSAVKKNPFTHRERVAMPLINTPFKLGKCLETIEAMDDPDERNIALAEYYYFSGQAENVAELVEPYLTHSDIALKVSACWLYAYANIMLNNPERCAEALTIIEDLAATLTDTTPIKEKAYITSASTGASVLLHLPMPKILTQLSKHIHTMPAGLRLFVLYIEAHHSYLNKYYGTAIGIAETALSLEGDLYPIPTVYLHLIACIGYLNLKHPEEAKRHLLEAYEIARHDDIIQPISEHHGLVGGTLEATIKRFFPDDFKRIISLTYKFSTGWRRIHNRATGNSVTDILTTTEFAAAMLAARDWTNQEIAHHMGISEYTARHHISTALQKLGVSQRKDLQRFLLK